MNYHYSFFDLWPYIITIAFIIYAGYQSDDKSALSLYIYIFLFCALRYDVGWDYTAYANEVKHAYNIGWDGINERYEYLSRVIMFMGVYFKFYPIVFILFSFFTLFLVYKSIQLYSDNQYISWLGYIAFPLFFFSSLSTIRQGLAMSIILYSYKYIRERKYVSFFMSIFIATLFHQSGIAGVLLLPVSLIKISRKLNIYILLLSFLLLPLVKHYTISILTGYNINERFLSYVSSDEYFKPRFVQYLYYAVGIFNIVKYKKLVNINNNNYIYIQIYTFGLFIYNVLIFEPISAMRISAFFLIFIIYIMPHYYKVFKYRNSQIANYGLKLLLFLMVFAYFYINIKAFDDGINPKIGFIPYDVWINHIDL